MIPLLSWLETILFEVIFINKAKMKVLSLLQPWATLVVTGIKKIETRSWNTKYRGDLLIHASMGKAGSLLTKEPPFTKYISDFNKLPFGKIIGKVTLQEVIPVEELNLSYDLINQLTIEEKAFGDYGFGRYGWVLTDPVKLESPIASKGHLHLWEYNGPLLF
jgi:hypothetical protein